MANPLARSSVRSPVCKSSSPLRRVRNFSRKVLSRIANSRKILPFSIKQSVARQQTRPYMVETLEPRLLMSADPLAFAMTDQYDDLTLQLREEQGVSVIQIIDNVGQGSPVLMQEALANVSQLFITGSANDDTLTIDESLLSMQDSLLITFDGGEGYDSLKGEGVDVEWNITGDDSGVLEGSVSFSGVEHLQGADNNQDTFIFSENGTISGLVDGGVGGFDTAEINGGQYARLTFTATGPDSGSIARDSDVINYAGLEPIIDNTNAVDRVFTGTTGDDQIEIKNHGDAGKLIIESTNNGFESIVFNNPVSSLTVNAGDGDDTVVLSALDNSFTGNLIVRGDAGNDTLTIFEAVDLNSGDLDVVAETITLSSAGSIATTGLVSLQGESKGSLTNNSAGLSASPSRNETAVVTVDGDIQAGQVVLSATAENATTLSSSSLTVDLSVQQTTTASVALGAQASIRANSLSISTDVSGDIVIDADGAVLGATVSATSNSQSTITVAGGAQLIIGNQAVSAEESASVLFSATDSTGLYVDVATGVLAPGSLSLARTTNTRVQIGDDTGSTLLQSGGGVSLSSVTSGTLSAIVRSDWLGSAANNANDITYLLIEKTDLDATALDAVALNNSAYTATAKQASNTVTGAVLTSLTDSTVDTSGAITLMSQDQAVLTAASSKQAIDLGELTSPIDFTRASATNEFDRSTGVVITGTDITTVAGNLSISAERSVQLSAQSEGASLAGAILSKTPAFSLGGNFAANSVLGSTTVAVSSSSLLKTTSAGDLSLTATDSSKIHSKAELSVETKAEGLSSYISGASLGASAAFNMVGWETGNLFLAGVDELIGTGYGTTERTNETSVTVVDSVLDAVGDLLLKAMSLVAVNSTVANTSSTTTSGFYGASGMGAGGTLAGNRISNRVMATIEQSGNVDGTVKAGGSVTVAADDQTSLDANTKLVTSTITTSDGGANVLNQSIRDLVDKDYQSTDGVQTLPHGTKVQLADDYDSAKGIPGAVYEYMGTGESVDLNTADYTDLGFWRELPATNLIPEGNNLSDSNSAAVGGVFVRNTVETEVDAHLLNVRVDSAALSVTANEAASVKATTDSSVESSGGSVWGGGRSLAVNGTIATNTLLGSTKAYIQDSHLEVTGGNILLSATNTSTVEATNFSATKTGANAVGFMLAFNTGGYESQNLAFDSADALAGTSIGTQTPLSVEAYLKDTTVNTDGNLSVTAENSATLTSLTSTESTSAAAAFFGASGLSASGVLSSNMVSTSTDASISFTGNRGLVDVSGLTTVSASDTATIEATSNIVASATSTNDLGTGIVNNLIDTLLNTWQYTNNSGTQSVTFGDQIRLADDFSGNGDAGALYRYMGTDANRDLATADYTDYGLWQKLDVSNVIPVGIASGAAQAFGLESGSGSAYYALIVRNDLDSAVVAKVINVELNSDQGVDLSAVQSASLSAYDGSVVSAASTSTNGSAAKGGVLVSNQVLSKAEASIDDSVVTTTGQGDIAVTADNSADIDASATTSSRADDSVAIVVAFNAVGWDASNLAFVAADALLGDNLLTTSKPVSASATVLNSTLNAGGDIAVNAVSAGTINAVTGAEAQSNAKNDRVLVDGIVASGKAPDTSLKKLKFGSNGLSAGGMLASNRVNSQTQAFIKNDNQLDAGLTGNVTAGGAVTVDGDDSAVITSSSELVSSAVVTNNIDAFVELVDNLVGNDYQYTTLSGTQTLQEDDRVKLDRNWSDVNERGVVYRYIGENELSVTDWSQVDFSDTSVWARVTGNVGVSDYLPNVGNLAPSESRAGGGMVVLNDARGDVDASIENLASVQAASVAVNATENATVHASAIANVTSSGGSAWGTGVSLAVNGQIVTNIVLSEADATIKGSSVVTSSGNVSVNAENTSQIDSTLLAATNTGDTAVGVTLAFNTIGWDAQNFLFNAADAIIGSPEVAKAFGNKNPAHVNASVQNSSLNSAGDVTVKAVNTASVNATMSNAASSAASALFGAGGMTVGAVIASNMVASEANAWIDNTSTTSGRSVKATGDLLVHSEDNSSITSNAKIVHSSITANDGGAGALSETLSDIYSADFNSFDGEVTLRFGDRVRLADDFSPAIEDYTSDNTSVVLAADDLVRLADDHNFALGTAGSLYRFVGTPTGSASNLMLTDFTTDDWEEVSLGEAGQIYTYMGEDATSAADLSLTDYTDLGYWKRVLETELVPQGYNVTGSNSYAVGGVFVRNGVESAVDANIDNTKVNAGDVTVKALANTSLQAKTDTTAESSGGSAFGEGKSVAFNGTIATNMVLGDTTASITNSDVSAGSVTVDGDNSATMVAETLTLTNTGDKGVGLNLAFNTVGWEAQNVLFNTADAIIGDPDVIGAFGNEDPAQVRAFIQNTDLNTTGAVSVTADNTASITANIANETSSAASALVNANGTAVGGMIATNMVSSGAEAFIQYTGAQGSFNVGGALTVHASDNASITSDADLKALQRTTNDGGLSIAKNFYNNLLNEYQYTSKSGTQTLNNGDMVRLAGDYATLQPGKGSADTLYIFQGTDGTELDLASVDYTSGDWSRARDLDSFPDIPVPLNVTPSNSVSVGGLIVRNDVRSDVTALVDNTTATVAGDVLVEALETATIDATISSAVTSSGGSIFGNGKSVAVNGTIATNLVQSSADARVKNSSLTTSNGGDVAVKADNSSSLKADISSETISNGVSVGVTLAFNTLGYQGQNLLFNTADALAGSAAGLATENPSEALAIVENSRINAAGAIELSAKSNATIDADVKNAATSIVGSLGNNTAVSVGAVLALNTLSANVEAGVNGSSLIDANGGALTVTAINTSTVKGDVSAPSLSVGVGAGTNTTVSVGLSLARNEINGGLASHLTNVTDVQAAGNIALTASEAATINATSEASAISVAAGLGSSKAFSGGGASAVNTILSNGADNTLSGTRATVSGSNLTTSNGGAVLLSATNTSGITAKVKALSVSVGAAASGFTPTAAIGVSIARNFIGWDEYNGQDSTFIQAVVKNSSIDAAGRIGLTARAQSSINATVAASAVAVGASTGSSVALGGSGLETTNNISTTVKAAIEGGGDIVAGNGDITLDASDISSVTADAQATSVTASLAGSSGGALSIGVSLARNTIDNSVTANIADTTRVDAEQGSVDLNATSNSTIDAQSRAIAISVAAAGNNGFALSGGGAESTNIILSDTHASIRNSSVDASQNVTVDALNSSGIDAKVLAVSGSLGFGGGSAAAAVAIGASVANNFIGYNSNGSRNALEVKAYLDDVSLTVGGSLAVRAQSTQDIDATVIAGAVGISASGTGSAALVGAGADAENKIGTLVESYIVDGANDGSFINVSGSTLVQARDSSTIYADAGAGALAVSAGQFSGSVAVGIALANNEIDNTVRAYVGKTSGTDYTDLTSRSVTLDADSTATVDSRAIAASVSAALSIGFSVAAGGADSTNTVNNTVEAGAQNGSRINTTAGDISISADEVVSIDARVGSGGVSVGLVAGSIGLSFASGIVGSRVNAFVDGATLTTDSSHDIDVSASATVSNKVRATATSIAVGGIGLTAAGAKASATDNSDVTVSIGDDSSLTARDINLSAQRSLLKNNAEATGTAGTVGIGAAIGLSFADASVGGQVDLSIGNASLTASRNLDAVSRLTASTVNLSSGSGVYAEADAVAGGLAGASGTGTVASVTASPVVTARIIGASADLKATGNITVDARAILDVVADVTGITVNVVGVSVGVTEAAANLRSDVDLLITGGALTAGGNITLGAKNNFIGSGAQASRDAYANAQAPITLGTIGAGTGSKATANATNTVDTTVSGGSLSAGGSITVDARNHNEARSNASGLTLGGLAGVGVSIAESDASGQTTTTFSGAVTRGSSVSILADGRNRSEADAIASSGSIGVAARGTIVSADIDNAVNAVTLGNGADITGVTGNVTAQSLATNVVDGSGRGGSGGFVGVGLVSGDASLTSSNTASIGNNASITAGNNFTLLSSTSNDGDAYASGSSGGVIDISQANTSVTLSDATRTTVGNNSLVNAGNTAVVESRMASTGNSRPTVDTGGLGVNADVGASISLTGNTSTTVGSSEIRGLNVDVLARVTNIDIRTNADSEANALGADSDASSTVNTVSNVNVNLNSGAQITGLLDADIQAKQESIYTKAESDAETNGGGGDTDASTTNNLTANSTVTAANGSTVTSRDTTVEASVESTPVYSSDADIDKALIDFGSTSENRSINMARTINFDGDVVISGASPELEIAADGTEIIARDLTYTKSGNNITVNDLRNTGSLAGTVNFIIPTTVYDHKSSVTRAINGDSEIRYETGFESVRIVNHSDRDLTINNIQAQNTSPQFTRSISVNAGDDSGFTYNVVTVPGDTEITLLNSNGDVRLNGLIDNPYGSTSVTSENGDIESGSRGAIRSTSVSLTATQGVIGSDSSRIRIDADLTSAAARGDIFITGYVDDLKLGSVSSSTGDVILSAVGSILDVSGNSAAEITGQNIHLTAATGSVGTTSNALEINATAANNALTVLAAGDVVIADVSALLSVASVSSTGGDVALSTVDQSSASEHLVISTNGLVRALSGSVSLLAGDNLLLAAGAVVSASVKVNLRTDENDADVGEGSHLELLGQVNAPNVAITTGSDADIVAIRSTSAGNNVVVNTGFGTDRILLGSAASATNNTGGLLDNFRGTLVINGNDASDTLELDDSGDTRTNTGSITASGNSTSVTGFGITGSVSFDTVESLRLTLGSGADEVTVNSTRDGVATRIDTGAGSDTINLGNGSLNALSGSLEIRGDGGSDTLNLDDSSDSAANTLIVTDNRITGAGLGSSDQSVVNDSRGVTYIGLENLNITLGSGSDQVQVEGINAGTETVISGGEGDDTFTLAGDLSAIRDGVKLAGDGGANNRLVINSDVAGDLRLDVASSTVSVLTGNTLTGRVEAENMVDIAVTLSDGSDTFTIADSNLPVTLNTAGGADTVVIEDIHATVNITLGDGSDEVTVLDAHGQVSVDGSGTGTDSLTVDRTAQTAQVTAGRITNGLIDGLGLSDVIFSELETVDVKLGSGNDTFTVNSTLTDTIIGVDGGVGDDLVDVLAIGAETNISGGDNVDTLNVTITGLPQADQFLNLNMSVETLIVDNTSNTEDTAWTLRETVLEADAIPSVGNVLVLNTAGADRIRLLGGSGTDSLDIVSETAGGVTGSIDGNTVALRSGQVVLEPGGFETFRNFDTVIDFDSLVNNRNYHVEDGMRLETSTSFTRDDSISPAVTTNGRYTLTSATGGAISLYSLELSSAAIRHSVGDLYRGNPQRH